MQLVEKHVIKANNSFFAAIDEAAFAAKNLYNLANYTIRQNFFETGIVYSFPEMNKLLRTSDVYKALPAKVSQQVLRLLDKNWKSFGKAKAEWKKNPEKFLGRPALPKYKDKEKGRNILVYTIQAISKPLLKIDQIRFSGLPVAIKTKQKEIAQVRVVPKSIHYVIEVVYNVEPVDFGLDKSLVAGIDLGSLSD